YFFFQAEDGIRDFHVTGVQTCALPICITKGKPNSCAISLPSKNEVAVFAGAKGISILDNNCLNCSRSSVTLMALISTPINFTLKSCQIPFSSASKHKFKAVCPPIVGNTASISG